MGITHSIRVTEAYSESGRQYLACMICVGLVTSIKVRADFYNVINHTNLTGVTSDLNSALFGRSTGNYQPRTIQLGARVEF